MKQSLLEEVSIHLLKKGFTIKSLTRTAFDILARKEGRILLIKILEDANSISEEYALQMNHVASYIGASPLIIAGKAGASLHDNIVYLRFGIYTLNFETFKACMQNKFPFIKSDHAGITAHVLGDKIKRIREEEGISLGDIARKVGVSKKMIQKYEKGEAEVTINKALKIYDVFGHSVFDKIDIFRTPILEDIKKKSDVSGKYSSLGFEAIDTKKVPFDVIARREREIVLTEIGDKENPHLKPLSRLLDAGRLSIYKKKKPKDIPALTKEEFMEFEKARALLKFLKEFE
jgi:putative transcriptional regulator